MLPLVRENLAGVVIGERRHQFPVKLFFTYYLPNANKPKHHLLQRMAFLLATRVESYTPLRGKYHAVPNADGTRVSSLTQVRTFHFMFLQLFNPSQRKACM